MLVSKMKISPSTFGKISYIDLEFHKQLLRIMGLSLTTSSFEHYAQS